VNVQDPLTEVDDCVLVLVGVMPVPRVNQHAYRVAAHLRKGGTVAEAPQELVSPFAPTVQRADDLQRESNAVLGQNLRAGPQPALQSTPELRCGDLT
jgi:hypothetical protein